MVSDEALMHIALEKAWAFQGLTFPNPAVGAVICDEEGNIIAAGAHEKAGEAHAEVNAIKKAYFALSHDTTIENLKTPLEIHKYLYENHQGLFYDKSIYITLEPCNHEGKTPPCATLLSKLKFKNIVIGTLDPNKTASGGYERLQNEGLHVKKNILEKECQTLLEPFSTWQNSPFVFFKLALSKNGAVSGGTISSEASRKHVHALRDKVELLVIGGNTVRIDRPTLDARMISGRAPDVLIYSSQKEFDTTIPLFCIPNRKVFIEDNLEKMKEYKFVMIEGGEQMLESVRNSVDWYLFYQSPNEKNEKSICIDIPLKPLFSKKIGEDKLTWYKKING
jgi:diaminohydroxyphosphoribosylaminopyrimidine deaminase/5-amino-6-(5-phosphoribosylamino)uracil reductase